MQKAVSQFWKKPSTSWSQSFHFFTCLHKIPFGIRSLFRRSATQGIIRDLLTETNPVANEFKRNIRLYNSNFNFASLGVQFNNSAAGTRGPYAFRIHGNVYHHIGSLLPPNGVSPVAAQLYVVDPEYQVTLRSGNGNLLNSSTVSDIQQFLHKRNGYVRDFIRMADAVRSSEGIEDLTMVFKADGVPDPRRYNLSTTSEIGILFSGRDGNMIDSRDIVLRTRTDEVRRILHLE